MPMLAHAAADPCARPAKSTVAVTLEQDQGGLKLSRAGVPCGTVTFVVTDGGTLPDSLHVFANAPHVKGSTRELRPGQVARLTIVFRAKGVVFLESGDYPPSETDQGAQYDEQGHLTVAN